MAFYICTKCEKKYERFNIGDYGDGVCPSCKLKGNCIKKMNKKGINNLNSNNKSMKNILIGVILCLGIILACVVSNTSAISIGSFKQGTAVELTQLCDNGATICSECNISYVKLPNSTIIIQDVLMTKRTLDFNYTITPQQTMILGTYLVGGVCNDASLVKSWSYNFIITPGEGDENNTLFFFILLGVAVGFLVLSFFMEEYSLAFISGIAFLTNGVYTMIYGFANLTNVYTRIIAFFIVAFGIMLVVISSLEWINESFVGGEGDDDNID